MSNKALWNSVSKTDPRAVKPITGKTYKGNSPKPYWLIERATEEFGPIGIGWGVDVKSERFERLGEFDVLHVAVVSVWYFRDGVRSQTFDQMGGTKAAYMSSKGSLIVDEDAGKKSVTDGMVKCLSMIGFAGDIFSGRWDDSKYVEETAAEFIAKERAAARAEWLEEQALRLESSENLNELGEVWKAIGRVVKAEDDQDALQTLEPIKDRMKAAISPQGAKA
tara:strand:- start:559 stop:1224 length:666 start_codon:yes stop_codon:yes gene_type:complete